MWHGQVAGKDAMEQVDMERLGYLTLSLVGSGGSILMLPILFYLLRTPIHPLAIIQINYCIPTGWINLTRYFTLAFLGVLVGLYIAQFINGKRLKKLLDIFSKACEWTYLQRNL